MNKTKKERKKKKSIGRGGQTSREQNKQAST
jgi:hypothetical protein